MMKRIEVIKRMTRDEALKHLYTLALRLSKEYDYRVEDGMWTLCMDWNSLHEDREEIFMCDDEDEEGKYRFYIEDDYFYPAE